MILLDFRNIEPWSCCLWGPPESWTEVLYFSSFLANAIFTVDGADFSSDYPLVGFARHLKQVANNLKASGSDGFYMDPECENPIMTVFRLDQNDHKSVIVSAVNSRDKANTVLFSAKASVDEFAQKSVEFLDRVVEHCCQFCPEIKTNKEIQRWLSDLSIPTGKGMEIRTDS